MAEDVVSLLTGLAKASEEAGRSDGNALKRSDIYFIDMFRSKWFDML